MKLFCAMLLLLNVQVIPMFFLGSISFFENTFISKTTEGLSDAYLMIFCEANAKIIVDGEEVGEVKAKEYKRFTILAGDHAILIKSIDGLKKWEGQIHATANEQTLLKPMLIPTDPTVGIPSVFKDPRDQREYRTIKIKDLEWFGQNYASEVYGTYGRNLPVSYPSNNNPANVDVYGRLYRFSYIGSPPAGWRLPTESDYQNMLSNYPDAYFDALVEGKSGFLLKFAGIIEINDPMFFGDATYLWTSTPGPPRIDLGGKSHPTRRVLFIDRKKRQIKWENSYLDYTAMSVRFVRDTK